MKSPIANCLQRFGFVPGDMLDELDVFYGELTVARAQIYARLPRPADDAGLTLSGQVRGPRCLHAQTLPTSLPLIDQGSGPTLLARATLPDPVCWSPDLPAIYDVTVSLHRGGEVLATARREIGLRLLGVRGKNLFLEGKRWVLRGVTAASTTATLPREWHESAAALVMPADHASAAEEILGEASQWGALTLIELDGGVATADRLRGLARYPGVAIAAIHGDLPVDMQASRVCPNVLLAQSAPAVGDFEPRAWANLLLVAADDRERLVMVANSTNLPVVAIRRLRGALSLPEARAACDLLQRDLAPVGQFAGYIV